MILKYPSLFSHYLCLQCHLLIGRFISPNINVFLFIMYLSLFTMSYVDKKIDHIFVRNTFLFACDKRRRSRSISVQGENNRLFCPRRWRHCDTQENVTDEEASQIDTAEMKNLNEKYKAESGIIIFNDCDSTVGELRNPEDIGLAEMNMHLARFTISARTKFQEGLRIWFNEMYLSFHHYIS